MNKFRILFAMPIPALAVLAGYTDARAGDIGNAALAGLVLNNTIPDNDFYALNQFEGTSMTDVLSTNSTNTTTGFTQTMTGSFLGQTLSVTYSGDSSAFPGGAITWTSTGSYGSQAWNSFGEATFTFPTSTSFQVAYDSTLAIGTNTMVTNVTISGADNGSTLFYTGTSGTLTENGVSMPAPLYGMVVPLNPKRFEPDEDYIVVDGRIYICSDTEIEDIIEDPELEIDDEGEIYNCPEPSSLVLAGLGVLGVLAGCAFRRQGKHLGHSRRRV